MRKIRYIIPFFILIFNFLSCSKNDENEIKPSILELDLMFFTDWDKPEYEPANTAKNISYLTNEEKRIYYYLNLCRLNPSLFATTYAEYYNGAVGYPNHPEFNDYKKSLIQQLKNMLPLPILEPDSLTWEMANCYSAYLGENGTTGHDRSQSNCLLNYKSENIAYGHQLALEIVMQLLIDYGVPELTHRNACLGNFTKLGVSLHEHIELDFCTVLDFN